MSSAVDSSGESTARSGAENQRLYTLIAELTYRCPLRCPYCSNPLDFSRHKDELTSEDWRRVLREASELGALQVNLTGGEPLLRDDLESIVEEAGRLDYYANLITSGVPLTRERLANLQKLGLSSVQVSFQDSTAEESDRIGGRVSFDEKLRAAGWVKELGLPLTVNVVLHRSNLERVPAIIALAERLGADRLELANTQYLGWALENREALLPTREQLAEARIHTASAKERLKGRMEILFVLPDYYADRPKSCMNGWGSRYMVVTPDGLALPCHLAHTLPNVSFDKVSDRSLQEIWTESEGFAAFRGEAWLPDPCRSCERRSIDFGGCRCQAFHLTGNAAATDPVCSLSPDHRIVLDARRRAATAQSAPGDAPLVELRYRRASTVARVSTEAVRKA